MNRKDILEEVAREIVARAPECSGPDDGLADDAERTAMRAARDHAVGTAEFVRSLDVPTEATEGFAVGDIVEKHTGDYQLTGEIRACFTTRAGKVRYVVEHEPGFLHIYGGINLRHVGPRARCS